MPQPSTLCQSCKHHGPRSWCASYSSGLASGLYTVADWLLFDGQPSVYYGCVSSLKRDAQFKGWDFS